MNYKIIIPYIIGIILVMCYFNHNTQKTRELVDKYFDACNCTKVYFEDEYVGENCVCKTYPEDFKREMEKG